LDLDETFWKGILTEGGIEYQQSPHDIVIELARRGIMSSICESGRPRRSDRAFQHFCKYTLFTR
jgi:hypothetical protein